MGNSSRSPEDYEIVSKYREEDWMHECNEEGLQIWRNRLTNEAAVLMRLNGVPSSEDMDNYTTRTMQNDLVKVHNLLIDQKSDLCALYSSAHLLVQHIPLRLANLRNFDREQALTILAASLRAFHLLQIKFGPVVPSEELIGFNEQGKTKVWLNRNSSLNYADRRASNEQMQHSGTRVQMLFDMIEQRARYVLLPPVIKEEIYHPLTNHLSAIKTLEKFAYYEKLNLRKYLQLGHNRIQHSTRERTHTRNRSYFTQVKQGNQLCCDQNESSVFSSAPKDNEMRRNYSLNNIHKQQNPNQFYFPPQVSIGRRSDMQQMIKHSIISNHSSFLQSARPSTVIVHCNNPNISTTEQVRNNYHRQGGDTTHNLQPIPSSNKNQVQVNNFQVEHSEFQPEVETTQPKELKQQFEQMKIQEKVDVDVPKNINIQILSSRKEEEPTKGLFNQERFPIVDLVKIDVEDIRQQSSQRLQRQQESIQPKSPTFLRNPEPFQLLSFAPSQQHFEENKLSQDQGQSQDQAPKIQINYVLLENKMKDVFMKQQEDRKQEEDESRRLSIQKKAPKLQFAHDFVLDPGSLLNYCTSVESKLHMATNREHSIIDHKPKHEAPIPPLHHYQDQQIERYIRQKYKDLQKEEKHKQQHKNKQEQGRSKVKRVESKYEAAPHKHHAATHKLNPNARYETSLNRFDVEQDFLDVNFMEKSLDKRYNNESHLIKAEEKRKQMEQNDALNIAKLEEGLLRFSKSQLSQKNSEHNPSKQHISKKHEQSQHQIQHSTGFDSYYPFKEKKINQQQQVLYLPQKPINRGGQHRNSKYQEQNQKKRYEEQYREYQDNSNEYSFEGQTIDPYSVSQPIGIYGKSIYNKETQLSTNEYPFRSRQAGTVYDNIYQPNISGPKPRSSVEQAERSDWKAPSQSKPSSTRKISYEQLRQFLWN